MNNPGALCNAIMDRLTHIIDPETGVDIMRMRLIEDLTVDEGGCVSYTFRPSSPLCPLAVPLAVAIQRTVRETPGVKSQTMHVKDYVRSDELTALLHELDEEHGQTDR